MGSSAPLLEVLGRVPCMPFVSQGKIMAMSTDFLLRPATSHPRLLSSLASSRGCCSRHQHLIQQECYTIDRSWKQMVAGCFTTKQIVLRNSKPAISSGWKQLNATSGHSLKPEPEAYAAVKFWNLFLSSLDAFYRFSRPHTVIVTALSIVSVSLLAVEKLTDFSPPFFTGLLQSFGIGLVVGSWPLFWALFISFLLGTAYSIDVLGHTILAAILWNNASSVNLRSKTAIASFYMFIWKLFYAEYLLIPLVR